MTKRGDELSAKPIQLVLHNHIFDNFVKKELC